jgi:CSLREA domain-containing protein/uncharacterized repeat protein (TIGR01451 family)
MLWQRTLTVVGLTLPSLLWLNGVANAATTTFTVNKTSDTVTEACLPGSPCTLREAIEGADAAGGTSTIIVPAGTYTLTIPSTGADDPTTGDLDIDDGAQVTIKGAGVGATIIDANYLDRAFTVQSGSSLTLSGMTIENGSPSSTSSGDGNGGAVYADGPLSLSGVTVENSSSEGSSSSGGGIYASTGLSVKHSTFLADDAASNGGAIFAAVGATLTNDRFLDNTASNAGAVVLGGSSTVNQDEFDGNVATVNDGALAVDGSMTSVGSSFIGNHAGTSTGGVLLTGNTTLVDATISDNSASAGGGLLIGAGGLALTMTNDTIAFNRAGVGGGIGGTSAFFANGSSISNTIVAENLGGDCGNGSGPTTFPGTADAGNNLDSDGTCFQGDAPSDLISVNPLLGTPADNGGDVQTDALAPNSPAVNTGTNTGCPTNDARGVARPQQVTCDIGAYEYAPSPLSLSNVAPARATSTVPFTYTITVRVHGPGPSTATTISDQLPAGSKLYAATASQGSCTTAGLKARCSLGALAVGTKAKVTLVAARAQAGPVTDTASATNGESSAPHASATTRVQAPVAPAGATAPRAVTGAASQISSHGARLHGSVKPGGQPTAYFFQFGATKSYGSATAPTRTGKKPVQVSAAVARLKAGTLYHYRLVAINDSGISYGRDRTVRLKGHSG